MSYITAPDPAPETILFHFGDGKPFTWADHKQIEAMLQQAEDDNPVVASARLKVDMAMKAAGIDPEYPQGLICEYCWRPVDQPHEDDCRDNNDPSLWVTREARYYKYLGDDFVHVHETSVPMTDEEALEYFSLVQTWFVGTRVTYIMRCGIGETDLKMMPYTYNPDTKEVTPIAQPQNYA